MISVAVDYMKLCLDLINICCTSIYYYI